MTRKTLGISSLLVVLALSLAGYLVGASLPADGTLPIHWGVDGTADRYADKWVALLLPAGLAAGISLIFFFLPALEPRQLGLERSQGLYRWGWLSMLVLAGFIQLSIVSEALSWKLPSTRIMSGAVGLTLVMIGNQLGKTRSMYTAGIRTPWTLSSEEVWIKTHRLGGKLMVVAGIAALLASLIAPVSVIVLLVLTLVSSAALVPVAYSYLLARREKAANS